MKKINLNILLFIPLSIMLFSCQSNSRIEKMKQELLETDIEFSRQSVDKGVNYAFLAYISDDCVLLRPKKDPIKGREKITEMFSKPDSGFTLSWTPLHADVAKSGDMGYTYGIYKTELDNADGSLKTTEGTYVSIWKRDANGDWKFVLDSGNQGLGNNSQAE